jgi:hypothetical protein
LRRRPGVAKDITCHKGEQNAASNPNYRLPAAVIEADHDALLAMKDPVELKPSQRCPSH